jgi:PAS domain S-box-containing protein
MDFADTLARAVLSTSSDAIVAADKDGIIRFWNPGAERIFGHASGAAIGQSLDIIIPERLRKRHWDGYRHVINGGESRYGHGDLLSVPAIGKDGAVVSIEFTIVPLRDGGDHARHHETFRGDARTAAEARGRDNGIALSGGCPFAGRIWHAPSSP